MMHSSRIWFSSPVTHKSLKTMLCEQGNIEYILLYARSKLFHELGILLPILLSKDIMNWGLSNLNRHI